MENTIDPNVLAELLRRNPDLLKQAQAITDEQNELNQEASELAERLKANPALFSAVDAMLKGVTPITTAGATTGRTAAKAPKAKQAKPGKAKKVTTGVGFPSRATLEKLSDEELDNRITVAAAKAKETGKSRMLNILKEIKAARKGGGQPAGDSNVVKMPKQAPAKAATGGDGDHTSWRRIGEPKTIADAKRKRREAKSDKVKAKLDAWIEAHSGGGGVARADASGTRDASGGFGRGFERGNSGGASASPQSSANA